LLFDLDQITELFDIDQINNRIIHYSIYHMELSQPMFALMFVPGVSLIGTSIVADMSNRPRTHKWCKFLGILCL